MKNNNQGIIQKSSNLSQIVQCHRNSTVAEELFSSSPNLRGKSVVVLQVMLSFEGYYLIEIERVL